MHLSCQGNGSPDLVGDLGVREEAAAQLCLFNSLCFIRIRNLFLLAVKSQFSIVKILGFSSETSILGLKIKCYNKMLAECNHFHTM